MNISIRKAVVLIVTWIVANNGGLAQASPQLQGGVTATDYPPDVENLLRPPEEVVASAHELCDYVSSLKGTAEGSST